MISQTYLKNKKILVTGAGGFIGSHLVEALLELSAEVRAFVHYNSRNHWGHLEELPSRSKFEIDIISADLRDYHAVKRATKHIDIVFHLGASIGIPYSLIFPHDVVETNVIGTLNILKASSENQVSKIIHTSTSEVYGSAKFVPINEMHPINPQSPYAASKIAADKLAEAFFRSFSLPVSIIRPFNTFGPRQSLRAIIPTVIAQLLNNGKVVVGSLEPSRDFTFVSDTVRGFIYMVQKDGIEGETFNLGTQNEITIRDLIFLISRLLGVTPRIEIAPERIRDNKSEVMRLISDNSKALKILAWKPKFSLEEGINLTIEWLKNNKKACKTDIYNV